MYKWRFKILSLCTLVGILFNQYVVVYANLMWGVVVGLSTVIPSIANWSSISFSTIPMYTLPFRIVNLWLDHMIWLTLAQMSSLFRWLCMRGGVSCEHRYNSNTKATYYIMELSAHVKYDEVCSQLAHPLCHHKSRILMPKESHIVEPDIITPKVEIP